MAKELRRMGLDVVPAPGRGDAEMSRDVSQVAEVAQDIAKLGARARKIGDRLKTDIADTHAALDIAQDVSDALRSAAADLRGVLGVQTNSPPPEAALPGKHDPTSEKDEE